MTTPDPQKTAQAIKEAAMLALSYGAGNDIDKKEAGLRYIYTLADALLAPAPPQQDDDLSRLEPAPATAPEKLTHATTTGPFRGPESTTSQKAANRVMQVAFDGLAGREDMCAALDAYADSLRGDRAHLAETLCRVSQIFNGWRDWEEWSKWDEEVAQAVVSIQRELDR